MTTLRELLQGVADRGLSTRAMEKRVEDAARSAGTDMRLNRGTASLILSGKYKSRPSDATIRAIAFLAEVPQRVAFEAAGRPSPAAPFKDELPEGVDQLSPKRRRVAIEVLRALIEAEQLEHRAEEAAVAAADDAARPATKNGSADYIWGTPSPEQLAELTPEMLAELEQQNAPDRPD
ncbi:hypothetical protein NDR87_26150 [Nocardia sp. CDC159]|uniref:Immunity repressor n=1 Tax=Nocardia pulmonis TaxID=2951408 RepID=A0A9X2E639_9NOCA|nr:MULTISPECIES: hypothetical protein [Nocardia]MCM6774929.1 hypothetical protein [Nocardia pulmonis]MCM6789860.1 hypothetical protein [Nocardia sp. CDC159]